MSERRTDGCKNIKEITMPQSDWKAIYIMQSEYGDIKIGVSNNIRKRKKSIENNRMIKIANVYKTKFCSNPFEIEREMHRHFSKYKIRGEWFSCDMGEAISALDKMFAEKAEFRIKRYEKNLFDRFAKCTNNEIINEREYTESLENLIDFMVEISERKNVQIEHLISMVEKLRMEIKRKNEELEKYEYSEEML